MSREVQWRDTGFRSLAIYSYVHLILVSTFGLHLPKVTLCLLSSDTTDPLGHCAVGTGLELTTSHSLHSE